MSINFPQSTHVLRNDGLVPTMLLLTIFGVVLILWGLWFVLARIPITITCAQSELVDSTTIYAECPADQVRRVQRGFPAILIDQNDGRREIIEAVVLGVPSNNMTARSASSVEIFAFPETPLTRRSGLEVRIEVAKRSPLELLLTGEAITQPSPTGIPTP
jgi:hypothetical protein